ncbi:MAG: glycoside hydrolase family 5 protein [Treponema sp.]|nr:glycoside hydrolase family 5 protein [Treponema sp.]
MKRFVCKTVFAFALAIFLFPSCANSASSDKPITPEAPITDIFVKTKLYSTTNLVIDNGSKDFGSSTAAQIVDSMKFGWNLGNTLDAYAGGSEKNGWAGRNTSLGNNTETNWGMPKTTQAMIAGIKAKGFSAIRIPISWHDHIDSKYTISASWMARVKQIVDWAVAENLYVIINVHHDNITPSTCTANGHKGYSPASSCLDESKRYLYNVWCQIALAFNNGYDEHLVFETINEPRLPGDEHEWNWDANCSTCKDAAKCVNELNQLCLDAIRESGGNNAKRLVMVPAYVAAPGAALASAFKMPMDSASGRLALSVHMYTPYSFAMQDPGETTFTNAHKGDLDYWLGQLNTKFFSKGIPVVIGEMGATNKNNDSERAKWFEYYLGKVKSYKMAAYLWDNGQWKVPASGSFNELFGYYNRSAQTWYFDDLITKAIKARN